MRSVGDSSQSSRQPDVRVILVGRTGLDAKLRLDPLVELVRVRTAVEAVGEMADPFDLNPADRTVVIVAPDAEPATPSESVGDHAAEFLSTIRSIDPKVRVLRVGGAGATSESMNIYDGTVRTDMATESLRAAIRGENNGGPPTKVGKPDVVPVPAGPILDSVSQAMRVGMDAGPVVHDAASLLESMAPRSSPRGGEIGDEALVRQLVRGRDPLVTALTIINQRISPRTASFVPPRAEVDPAQVSGQSGGEGAAVAWDRHVYGSLVAPGVPASELAAHAAWLAGWLRLRDQQSQLRDAAFTDIGTGAFNRRFCERFLASAIEQARGARRNVTVLYFDVDNFKSYNDRFGHAAGDEILREVVHLLKASVRPADRVCRIGGDEFVVIFHEPEGPRVPDSKHPTSVFQIAKRFQRQIQEQRFPKLGLNAPGSLTISGGLATFPWDGATAQELIDRADQLALESKRQGKNVITIGPGAATRQTPEERGEG
jgi:diguanylate cyclase (GGDEF)-like protein